MYVKTTRKRKAGISVRNAVTPIPEILPFVSSTLSSIMTTCTSISQRV